MESLDDRKRALRALVRGRCQRPGAEVGAASEAALARLEASGLLAGARTVGLYRALPSEVQTAALAEALEQRAVRVLFPVVQSAGRALDFHPLAGQPMKSPLGIEEPLTEGPAVPLAELDALVLPGLAADAAGHRLGRGRGHYDATLAAAPNALAVLLLFDAGLVADVPVGEHDALVDAVCTESRLLLCSARARAQANGSGGRT